MSHWSPEMLFTVTYILSALSGVGGVLASTKPLSTRNLVAAAIVYGGLGSSFGMFVVYDYIGGKLAPARVLAGGMLVGGGAIKIKDITALIRRVFNINEK